MKNIAFLLVSLFVLTNCTGQRDTETKTSTEMIKEATGNKSEDGSTEMIHTVYFWLTDDANDERKKAFEKALEDLSLVPSIDKFYWGVPAKTEERGVIDSSYDYAINVFFDSLEDQLAYQVDPLHLKFVKENEAIFKKVIVYDNTYSK